MRWMDLVRMRPAPAQAGEINHAAMDRFTIVHFAIGMGYGFIGFGPGLTIFLAVVWEFVENPLKVHVQFLFPHATADTRQNMVFDGLAVLAGWAFYQWLKWP